MLAVVIFTAVVLWIFYKKYISAFKLWESRGIPSVPSSFPFGSSKDLPLFRKYMGHSFDDLYKKGAPHPYAGMYNFRQPILLIRDPEMVRIILAKEFSHFRDRQGFKIPEKDPLSHHLFNLEGERWRALRVKLSPTFTSGKIKAMFPLFIKCAEGLDNLLFSKLDENVDIKEVFGRFTTDIICSCAFGLEVNSMQNPDNEFRKIGANILKFSFGAKLKVAILRIMPFLIRFISLKFTPEYIERFLLNTIKSTVEQREKHNIKRNDFLDLLIELKNKGTITDDRVDEDHEKTSQPIEMTIEFMTAQCFVFFFAGFETSSSVQSYCLYELALHPLIQERLRKEIDTTLEKHGDITYQAVQEMEYLDMVVSETMRKYPTLPILTRRCTKTFVTPAGHRIEKNERIVIPVWSLHHDPAYFPKPDTFDPERFSNENKELIKPFSYLPFGEGPRICIGMRFGLLQTKTGLITILRKYKVEPSDQTTIPLEFEPGAFLSLTKGPIILKLTKRNSDL